jgi:phage replication O-like protein O
MMAQPAKVINMEEHRSQGPQVEDGFVRIANELFDAFLSFKFSYRQSKVFLAVLRKTFGYGKKSDDVSASQLGALCAMPRSHVASTLVELEKMNAITRSPGKYGTVTAINKNHWQWKKLDDEGEQKGSGGFGGAASRSPCDRRYHYVYRLDSTLSGEFYIGVRSCDCHPNQDRYMGSGCWPATVHKSNLKKTVLSLHETRAEAEEEEKRVIRSMADASDMKNRMRYDTAVACSESEHPLVQNLNSSVVQNLNTPSTESEQLLVQNLNSSVVQNLNTQKTTFQKTTPKDNPNRKSRKPAAQDLPLAPGWMPAKEWADFVEHRKQVKHPLTPLAAERLISKIAKLREAGYCPTKLIDAAIRNGWRDVFARDDAKAGAPQDAIRTTSAGRTPAAENFASKDYGTGGLI